MTQSKLENVKLSAVLVIFLPRSACSIELKEMVILTGGQYTMSKVTVYNNEGFVDDWPELNTGRNNHGCGHYVNTASKMVRHIDKGRRQTENTFLRDIVPTMEERFAEKNEDVEGNSWKGVLGLGW